MAKFDISQYMGTDDRQAEALAMLPLVPRDGIVNYPGCVIDDEFRHYEKLTVQHIYAVAIVYGPLPAGVSVTLTSRVQKADKGSLEPVIMATADPEDAEALTYLDNIRYGLDSWEEAAFPEPSDTLVETRQGHDVSVVGVATLRSILDFAASRLRLREDFEKLTNLTLAIRDPRLSELHGQ
jgi:hypothetical protein